APAADTRFGVAEGFGNPGVMSDIPAGAQDDTQRSGWPGNCEQTHTPAVSAATVLSKVPGLLSGHGRRARTTHRTRHAEGHANPGEVVVDPGGGQHRAEERRVGKECR